MKHFRKLKLLIDYYFCLFFLWLSRKTPFLFNFTPMFGKLLFPESANYPDMYQRYKGTGHGYSCRNKPFNRNKAIKEVMKDPSFAAMFKKHPEMLEVIKNPSKTGKIIIKSTTPEETPQDNPLARKDD